MRKKHRIADVSVVVQVSAKFGDQELPVGKSGHFGESAKSHKMLVSAASQRYDQALEAIGKLVHNQSGENHD